MNLKKAIKIVIQRYYPESSYYDLKDIFVELIKELTGVEIEVTRKPAKCKKEREQQFRQKVSKFISVYGEEMIEAFCHYWTESTPKGRKLRFEKQPTFDIPRRLVTWKNRSKTYKNGESRINGREQKENQKSPWQIELERLEKKYSGYGASGNV